MVKKLQHYMKVKILAEGTLLKKDGKKIFSPTWKISPDCKKIQGQKASGVGDTRQS